VDSLSRGKKEEWNGGRRKGLAVGKEKGGVRVGAWALTDIFPKGEGGTPPKRKGDHPPVTGRREPFQFLPNRKEAFFA